MTRSTAKARLLRLLLITSAILAVGLLYALFVSITGLAIPCGFRLITGYQCPGCGVSRMCLSLLHFDFTGAWQYNAAIMALLPLGAAVALDLSVRYVRSGVTRPDKFSNAAMLFMIAVLVVFGFLRNIL